MYDAAVIGGGVMGCSAALHLARAGMSVALLERGPLCRGASGVNAGTLTLHMTRPALIPYALRGWHMWTNARDWLGHDLEVQATDGLSVAFTADEAEMLEHRAQARLEQGAPVELVTPKRAREIEPGLTDRVRAAAHCPIDGFNTPYLLGRAFLKALVASGVTVQQGRDVTGIGRHGDAFEIVTGSELVRARRIVLAGGVWLEQMLGWLGIGLAVTPLVNQLAVTERTGPVMRCVLSVASGLLSLKQFANGTVLIGGGWQGAGERETGETRMIPENLIGNLRLARYAIPGLRDTRLIRTWFGFEAEVADAMPLVGPVPGVRDAFVIGSVHSGYTSGPYMGRLLAQCITGREPELPLFAIDRLLDGERGQRTEPAT